MAEAVQREAVTHARVQAVVRRMQQHVRPADRVVVPPGVKARELGQGGPRLGQERAGFRTHFLSLPLPPGVLLGLVQWIQGVGVVDVGVRVLALVVGERLVGGREVGRLEVRRRGVGQRRGARVGSLGHRAQLGKPGAVARDAIVPVLGAKRGEREEGRDTERQREKGEKNTSDKWRSLASLRSSRDEESRKFETRTPKLTQGGHMIPSIPNARLWGDKKVVGVEITHLTSI